MQPVDERLRPKPVPDLHPSSTAEIFPAPASTSRACSLSTVAESRNPVNRAVRDSRHIRFAHFLIRTHRFRNRSNGPLGGWLAGNTKGIDHASGSPGCGDGFGAAFLRPCRAVSPANGSARRPGPLSHRQMGKQENLSSSPFASGDPVFSAATEESLPACPLHPLRNTMTDGAEQVVGSPFKECIRASVPRTLLSSFRQKYHRKVTIQ